MVELQELYNIACHHQRLAAELWGGQTQRDLDCFLDQFVKTSAVRFARNWQSTGTTGHLGPTGRQFVYKCDVLARAADYATIYLIAKDQGMDRAMLYKLGINRDPLYLQQS